jgi:myo-inositol-1(or 4)-monophosphatase
MNLNLQTLCQDVCSVSKQAGEFIRTERSKFSTGKVEVKGKNDFVSYVDKGSEKLIVEALSKLLPGSGFIAEEGTSAEKGEVYNWIIDPLDGTTNFIHGLPCYAVSIALMRNKELILGVIYEVNLDECFYAYEGGKAYLNGKEISVSQAPTLADSLIATGFPIYNFSRLDAYLKTLEHMMRNTHGVRRIGAAAADLCYLACGRVDGFFEYNLNAWDVAAAALIGKEAGGRVCDFSGGDNWLYGKEIIADNSLIHSEFFEAIKL